MKSFSRLESNLKKLDLYANRGKNILTHEQYMLRERCEASFYEFVKHAWIHLEGREFVDGWPVGALCDHVQAIYNLEIRKLLYNGPPRTGKSIIVNAALPAWIWAKEPGFRFLYATYNQDLTIRDSDACRELIESEWYQTLWGDKYRLSKRVANKKRFNTNQRGSRVSAGIGGKITGEGGDINVIDDANNILEIHSEKIRKSTNDWFDFVFSSRFQRASTSRVIAEQQRGHMQDVSGHILAKDDPSWIHLCLPMEFEKARRCVTVPLLGNKNTWMDPRKEEGELLFPALIPAAEVERQKRAWNYDPFTIASQYQQWPTPSEGGILKEDWFQIYKQRDLPEFRFIMQSWDTALTKGATSCFSACTTWGVFEDKGGIRNAMLLSAFQAKLDFAELMDMAKRLAYDYNDVYMDEPPSAHKNAPHNILIEGKANGHSLFQMLQKLNLPVTLFNPTKYGDKVSRCHQISHYVQNGLVWLTADYQKKYEYLTEDSEILLNAARNFPMDEDSADIIDSMTQALIELSRWNEIRSREAPLTEDMSQRSSVNSNYDGLRI